MRGNSGGDEGGDWERFGKVEGMKLLPPPRGGLQYNKPGTRHSGKLPLRPRYVLQVRAGVEAL
jgi:hypothetical protein